MVCREFWNCPHHPPIYREEKWHAYFCLLRGSKEFSILFRQPQPRTGSITVGTVLAHWLALGAAFWLRTCPSSWPYRRRVSSRGVSLHGGGRRKTGRSLELTLGQKNWPDGLRLAIFLEPERSADTKCWWSLVFAQSEFLALPHF